MFSAHSEGILYGWVKHNMGTLWVSILLFLFFCGSSLSSDVPVSTLRVLGIGGGYRLTSLV